MSVGNVEHDVDQMPSRNKIDHLRVIKLGERTIIYKVQSADYQSLGVRVKCIKCIYRFQRQGLKCLCKDYASLFNFKFS